MTLDGVFVINAQRFRTQERNRADAIERLYHDPELFLRLSEAAAKRVRAQSDAGLIIGREVAVLKPVPGNPEKDQG